MLRDRNLVPLSHQHQSVLALCVRIDRAQPIPEKDILAWQKEIERYFDQEIKIHFAVEEGVLFPAAREFSELVPLVEELVNDHAALRESFTQAGERGMSAERLPVFAQQLSAHIRKEERLLFERMQQLMKPEELASLGTQLEAALKGMTQFCILPNEATRLKAKK